LQSIPPQKAALLRIPALQLEVVFSVKRVADRDARYMRILRYWRSADLFKIRVFRDTIVCQEATNFFQ